MKKTISWSERIREFFHALENLPRAFGLLWQADKASTLGLGAITFVDAGLPAAQAWAFKLVVDSVVLSLKIGRAPRAGLRAVLTYLLLELGLSLASAATAQVRQLVNQLIDHRLGNLITTRIIRKALGLEARWFEDSEFYDKLQNARRQSEYRAMALVNSGFMAAQNMLTLTSFLALLLAFNPWIALILFTAGIPTFAIQSHYSRLIFRLQSWRTPETRHMVYLEQLLTMDTAVKEIKLFELGEPLLKSRSTMFWKIFNEDAALAREHSAKSLLWGMLSLASYYGACAWVILMTVAGRLTLGGLTLYLSVFRQSQGAFQGLLDNIGKLYENGLFLDNLFGFLDLKSDVAALDPALRPAEDAARGIEFQDIWFRYPGTEAWVLQGFNLTIHPGEKLALVGENGAGKTTLIKLLTRLYEPDKGKILYRGVDLRYFTQEELHRRIGAIFQDYMRYQLSLRENIGFGLVEKVDDHAAVEAAAIKGGADEVAHGLPQGFDSRLGRWFDDGHELSGGQWQKVALGRAFMREAEVLILDEPTASLDAESEYEIFQRLRTLSEGRIALLVSHRFSTVRMADRIVVLKAGSIAELGTHEELLTRGGIYARLFELQAQGYR